MEPQRDDKAQSYTHMSSLKNEGPKRVEALKSGDTLGYNYEVVSASHSRYGNKKGTPKILLLACSCPQEGHSHTQNLGPVKYI